jgi:hypothetical protein
MIKTLLRTTFIYFLFKWQLSHFNVYNIRKKTNTHLINVVITMNPCEMT